MSTFTFRTRIARIAVAAVAAIGIAACSQAATADASVGQVTAKLTITQYKPGYHNVAVFGKVPMSQTEAQGLIDSGHRVVMRLWGDDSYSDDLLLGPYNATFYATSNGLEFHKVLIGLPDSLLDEDWGMDELYVGVRVLSPTGGTLRAGESNRWYDFF